MSHAATLITREAELVRVLQDLGECKKDKTILLPY